MGRWITASHDERIMAEHGDAFVNGKVYVEAAIESGFGDTVEGSTVADGLYLEMECTIDGKSRRAYGFFTREAAVEILKEIVMAIDYDLDELYGSRDELDAVVRDL